MFVKYLTYMSTRSETCHNTIGLEYVGTEVKRTKTLLTPVPRLYVSKVNCIVVRLVPTGHETGPVLFFDLITYDL